ncbi:MAG: hypothetical protein VCA55_10800 [Verrucomicrobiales bacterium]
MEDLQAGGAKYILEDRQIARGFSVIEAIVMLGVLIAFTLVVIALLIREFGVEKYNGQEIPSNASIEATP